MFALAGSAAPVLAQDPVELIADLNTGLAYGVGSAPTFAASDGSRAWFWARGADDLADLWLTDGSQVGTQRLVEDMAPVSNMVPWHYQGGLVLPSGRAVFIAPSSTFPASGLFGHPVGSDGTEAGSVRLDAPLPQTLLVAGAFEEFLGEAWFTARASQAGAPQALELWRTDGTAAGTRSAFDSSVALPDYIRGDVVAGGGHLYFVSDDASSVPGQSSSVWRTDGNGGPPTLIFTTPPDQEVELYCWLPAVGGVLAAVETAIGAPAVDSEWWAITPGGATLLTAAAISGTRWCVESGDQIFMVGRQGSGPAQLFVTDGTQQGTAVVPDNAQLLEAAIGNNRGTAYNGGVLCMAWDPQRGFEPAFADVNGVTTLIDAAPGQAWSDVSQFVEFGGVALFHSQSAQTLEPNLYRTDGTVAGTVKVTGSSAVGSAPLFPQGRTQFGVAYSFDLGTGIGAEPWSSDGFTPTLLADIAVNATASATAGELATFAGRLLLSAAGNGTGIEPFVTDGTAEGTGLLFEVAADAGSSYPGQATQLGNRVSFVAIDSQLGAELVLSDGSAAGTTVVDLNPGSGSAQISSSIAVDGALWFGAVGADAQGDTVDGLWRSDGSADGTALVAEVAAEKQFGTRVIFDAEGVGGATVFFAGVDGDGSELWRSDGTAEGTWRVADLWPGPSSSSPRDGLVVDGRFVFTADDGQRGREVWTTDGTAQGTVLLAEIAPGPASGAGEIGAVEYLGNYVVATPFDAVPSGPVAVDVATAAVGYLIDPGLSSTQSEYSGEATGGFLRFGDTLLFSTSKPSSPLTRAVLWRATDDQSFADPVGVDLQAGVPLRAAHVGAGFTLFAGIDALGSEPWVLRPDGVAASLFDLDEGPGWSSPGRPARLGSRVVFTAQRPDVGRELFATTVATIGANVATPVAGGCAQSGTVARLAPLGRPTLAADFDVALVDAAPLAPVVWVVDTQIAYADPLAPCAPLLAAPTFLALGATDLVGGALLDLALPGDPALLDLQLAFQALVVEVPGPYLGIASLSDGLEVVVGP